jgi:hypothetical protein
MDGLISGIGSLKVILFNLFFFFFFKFVFLDSVLSISTRRGLRERSRVGVRKPKVISHFPVMEL